MLETLTVLPFSCWEITPERKERNRSQFALIFNSVHSHFRQILMHTFLTKDCVLTLITYIYQTLLSKATYSAFRLLHFIVSMCVPWELNPQPFVLLTQCSTTEPQERTSDALSNTPYTHWFHNHRIGSIILLRLLSFNLMMKNEMARGEWRAVMGWWNRQREV